MAKSSYDHVYAKISPEPNTGCWIWTGAISNTGYGNVSIGNIAGKQKTRNVHRLIYELEVGPIKQGLTIDHLCRNRWCVNPVHLEPVTYRENSMRGIGPQMLANRNLIKTHCPKGHPYSGDNLYVYKNSRNERLWRGCCVCRKHKGYRSWPQTPRKSPAPPTI